MLADGLLGVEAVPVRREVAAGIVEAERPAPTETRVDVPRSAAPVQQMPRVTPAVPELSGDKAARLQQLSEKLHADPAITALVQPGTKIVFGEGDPDAALMFVGEGAGATEAKMGRPFVGPAGELLDKMIVAMGLSRDSVYITNMVHFRPPENRVPTPEEVELGRPYLLGTIQTVRPKVIVCLGGTAAKNMLQTSTGITRLRGQWHQYHDVQPPIDLMPTFHPAFLLRSYTRDNRGKAWSDLQKVMEKLGI